MQTETASFLKFILNPQNFIPFVASLVSIIVGLFTILPKTKQWLKRKKIRELFNEAPGPKLYPLEEITFDTHDYIKPFCQENDPTEEREKDGEENNKEDLFKRIENMTSKPTKYKFILLLADSGMGKTSFLLNYYIKHLKDRSSRNIYKLALVPLGSPNADEYIQKIESKIDTTLFLDAFDEDIKAQKNYRERLAEILKNCEEFRQVLITSRSQFFPSDDEIPNETGIVRFGVSADSHQYYLNKLYLSRLSVEQVKKYIKKHYPIWKFLKRKKAQEIVLIRFRDLSFRPMLLRYIQDILKTGETIQYNCQIYENIVKEWIKREQPYLKAKDVELIREFSEKLAIDLYSKREIRETESVYHTELESLAANFDIHLEAWKIKGRSLLTRDGSGYYKFAHRSIMEYLFVKRFLEIESDQRSKMEWTDQMAIFLYEILRLQYEKEQTLPDLIHVDLFKLFQIKKVKEVVKLRSKGEKLSEEDVEKMIIDCHFFDTEKNKQSIGIPHNDISKKVEKKVISDYFTGLMWQKGGSPDEMTFDKVKNWIEYLNNSNFAGFKDWRLPTLAETMSLLKPKNGEQYISSVFDKTQTHIWTSDVEDTTTAWVIDFINGYCSSYEFDYENYIRAVRNIIRTNG